MAAEARGYWQQYLKQAATDGEEGGGDGALAETRPMGAGVVGEEGDGRGPLKFGKFELKWSQCFYISPSGSSLAVVNLKPLLPGHVLVMPRRCVPTMAELTVEEVADLWRSVREVQKIVEAYHGAVGANLGVQDGRDAGQSVPHVHVHVLPR